ncbi:MAG: accessory gene regulator B family protein [Oscillospiraceae bacterium]|nr:accessory gene regulator B family protein [Oscillospiraceae bacterium]
MTEGMADRLSRYCVLRGLAKEEDREVLAYLLFLYISNTQQLLALAAVALILDAAAQTIAFLISFAALKRYAGGAHASKHWICLTFFTGMTAAVCLICKLIAFPPYVPVIAAGLTLALVLLKAPVIHPNNPQSGKSRKLMRKISVCVAVVQCALIALGTVYGLQAYVLPAAFGGLAAAAALLPPMPENSEE